MAHDDEKSSGEGSVWTSYSDLFMALAVVFLVLFIVTLMKAGVKEIKQAVKEKQAEEFFVNANVPKKVKQRNDRRQRVIEHTLDAIKEQKSELIKAVEKVNTLAKNLDARQKTVQAVLRDQLR